MPVRRIAAFVLCALCAAPIAGCSARVSRPDPLTVNTGDVHSPAGVVECVRRAWVTRDSVAYDTLMGGLFFYAGSCVEGTSVTSIFYGYAEEMEVVSRIFRAGAGTRPPVDTLTVSFVSPFAVEAVPGAPPDAFRRVTVSATVVAVAGPDTFRFQGPQVFTVQRGDGDPFRPDPTRWYLESWMETVPGISTYCPGDIQSLWGYLRTLYAP